MVRYCDEYSFNTAKLGLKKKIRRSMDLDQNISSSAILIVDDEAINRKLLEVHLKRAGFVALTAWDGQTALQIAQERLPDLILLDIMMPGLDGFETCRQLKASSKTRDIPVIFLSALSDTAVKARGLDAGGVDYVSKPFDSKELLARVRTHLTVKLQERQIRSYAENLEEMVQQRTRDLHQAQQEMKRDFEMQRIVATILRVSLDTAQLEDLLRQTLELILSAQTFSFTPSGSIHLVDQETGALRFAVGQGAAAATLPCDYLANGICGNAALASETGDVETFSCPNFSGNKDAMPSFCAPILYDGDLLGVINIELKPEHTLDKKESGFLRSIINTLARIIIYKNARGKLVESEERYRAIFENTGAAMAIVGPDTSIELVNTEFENLAGLPREQIQGRKKMLDFMSPDDVARLQTATGAVCAPDASKKGSKEFRINTEAGLQRIVSCQVSAIAGTQKLVVSLSDITERRRAEEQVLYHAFHDSLTGLPNRNYLLETLSDAVARGKEYAVLLIDLDRFTLINESLGHDIGDRLIMALADRLRDFVRPDDVLTRLGGDEFALLCKGISSREQATDLALRILDVLRQPVLLTDYELVNTASIGIALSEVGYSKSEDLLRDADTALHRAKQSGKARYVIFDHEMHLKAKDLLNLITDMRQALLREEFLLHYQPIVSLSTGRIHGFEALVRWAHPARGMVSPAEFIPEAEESGLIIPLGQWVLREACDTMRRLVQEQGVEQCVLLSVNLSGKQFAHEDILQQVRSALAATRFPPECLKLEITESVIMDDAAAAARMLRELKSLHVHISIDDFGTGYSSLAYLHRFPVDMLKIDRSFVNTIGGNDDNLAIVRTIIDLAHNLGLEVIAEGVETREQMDILRDLGCEYAQGYYYSRPLPPRDIVAQNLFHQVW